MGTPNLIPIPRGNNPEDIRRALAKLSRKFGIGGTPTFADVTITGLTASRLVSTDSAKKLSSVSDLSSWIAGTANQITVTSDGDGTITLATPQDTDTAATPTFADLTLSAPSNIYSLSHDSFADFVSNEHIDWTGAADDFLTTGFGTINGLIPGTDDTYDLGMEEASAGGGFELKESNTTNTGAYAATTTQWWAQTITPATDYNLSKVVFKLYRSSSPTTATLHVRATSAGLPTGGDLDSKTVDISTITASTAGEDVEFILDAPLALTGSTKYALILSGSAGGNVYGRYGSPSGYAGGNFCYSVNSGSSWAQNTAFDMVFEAYADAAGATTYTRWQDLYLSGSLKDGTNSITVQAIQDHFDDTDIHFEQTAIAYVSSALSTGLLKVTTGTGALSVVTDNSTNWNSAYGWGDHSLAGYAISGGAEHDGFSDFVANEHIDHTAVSISAGTGLTGGGDISASRTISISHLGIESLTDPGDDRLMGWDDTDNATKFIDIGTGLSYDHATYTLSATGTTLFTGLTDTPANYTGSAGKLLKVNSTPDALEFFTINDLTADDTPDSDADYAMTYDTDAVAHKKVLVEDFGPFGPVTRTQRVNLLQSDSTAAKQAKINALGKYIPPGQVVTFQFETGGTHTETNYLEWRGFFGGGTIYIYGNTAEAGAATKHTTQDTILDFTNDTDGLRITDNEVYIIVRNLRILVDSDVADTKCIFVDIGNHVDIWYNSFQGNSTTLGRGVTCRYVRFVQCYQNYVDNLKYGLTCTASRMQAWDNSETGTSPLYGLWCNQTGYLGKVSTQPAGSTANESVDSDSIIFRFDPLTVTGSMFQGEKASADTDAAGYGQWWTKNDTPCNPMFTDDAGTDFHLAKSDGTTGGSGSAGAGNQYIEINIGGTTYKVLHDGTV